MYEDNIYSTNSNFIHLYILRGLHMQLIRCNYYDGGHLNF